MRSVTLTSPRVVREEVKTTEVEILRVVEFYRKNKVVAFTSIGEFILWEGAELDTINARTSQWTDRMVETRLLEILEG